jgi:hypothetical protein
MADKKQANSQQDEKGLISAADQVRATNPNALTPEMTLDLLADLAARFDAIEMRLRVLEKSLRE